MTRPWRNWAGNQRTNPVRTVAAHDTGDVVAAVKDAARDGLRLKAVGSGHSFTAIAVPDGVAVRAPSDPRLLHVDADGLATVPAGMTLRALNPLLWERGRALPNLGDIDAQTVAGALATGTHGTGAHHGASPTRCARWSSSPPTASSAPARGARTPTSSPPPAWASAPSGFSSA